MKNITIKRSGIEYEVYFTHHPEEKYHAVQESVEVGVVLQKMSNGCQRDITDIIDAENLFEKFESSVLDELHKKI